MIQTLERAYRAALRFPLLKPLAPKLDLFVRYRSEWLLLNGLSRPSSERPSIVFFTVHKAASVYVARVLQRLASDSGLTLIDFSGCQFMGGKSAAAAFEPGDLARKVYRPRGYFYGPFRKFNEAIEHFDQYRAVLNLRDPRDVLVSGYFSVAYSHFVPDEQNPDTASKILAAREATLQSNIDEWVLTGAEGVRKVYADYAKHLLNRPNVLLARYEQMVTDFEGWLSAIIKFLDLQPKPGTLQALRSGASFDVEESVSRHKRQVTPGDHRRKLKPETVEKLNEIFGDLLDQFEFPRHV